MGFGDFDLEGIVLRNSRLIMLRLIISPISAALFPVAGFINTPKGLFIYDRKMDRRNTNWSLDCFRPIHNENEW